MALVCRRLNRTTVTAIITKRMLKKLRCTAVRRPQLLDLLAAIPLRLLICAETKKAASHADGGDRALNVSALLTGALQGAQLLHV